MAALSSSSLSKSSSVGTGINASADDVHLSAVGMGRLNVVYAHGDSDDAWGIFRYFAISFSADY